MAAKKSLRTRELSAIHVLKSKLGMDEDDYRAMLAEVAGVTSAGAIADSAGRQLVISHLRGLERRMGLDDAPSEDRQPKRGWMKFEDDDEPLVRKVKAMWIELGKAGHVERTTLPALNAWVKRHWDVDHVRWLEPKQLSKAVEMMKQWIERGAEPK